MLVFTGPKMAAILGPTDDTTDHVPDPTADPAHLMHSSTSTFRPEDTILSLYAHAYNDLTSIPDALKQHQIGTLFDASFTSTGIRIHGSGLMLV